MAINRPILAHVHIVHMFIFYFCFRFCLLYIFVCIYFFFFLTTILVNKDVYILDSARHSLIYTYQVNC